MHTPSPYSLPHGLFRLIANCWGKVDEELPMLALGPPRPEGIAQKVELGFRVIIFPVVIFAVDNAGFVRMEFQSTFRHSFFQAVMEFLRFLPATAVRYSIIGITREGLVFMVPDHPHVKRIVEKQIC